MYVGLKVITTGAMQDNVHSQKKLIQPGMTFEQETGHLYINFVEINIAQKLWAWFTLKSSWPTEVLGQLWNHRITKITSALETYVAKICPTLPEINLPVSNVLSICHQITNIWP